MFLEDTKWQALSQVGLIETEPMIDRGSIDLSLLEMKVKMMKFEKLLNFLN